MALSAPAPCLINFDRNENWILGELGMGDILRDRIVMPAGQITEAAARRALAQFEQDMMQAKVMQGAGKCSTVIIDGGSLLLEIITLVTLADSENKNNTFKYAGRNAYVKNFFNEANESGLNVIWVSKAKPLWVGDKKIAGEYTPDCHDDIPYMCDVNMQMRAERKPPAGLNYYGVIGMNAFSDKPVGLNIANMTWDLMLNLLLPAKSEETV